MNRNRGKNLSETTDADGVLFCGSHRPLVVMDPQSGRFIDCNDAAVAAYGFERRSQLLGKTPLEISAPYQYDGEESGAAARRHIDQALEEGSHVFGWRCRRPDGAEWDAEVHLMALRSGTKCLLQYSLHDVTERRRAEAILQVRLTLSEFALSHSLGELLRRTLDEAERLTGSAIGFFHFIGADQRTVQRQMWSTSTLQGMCTADYPKSHSDTDQAGVWVDALRQRRPVVYNDYAALPHRKGVPPGHAPVERLLSVPVMRGRKVVAILGVGNKPGDYCQSDVETLALLADLAWDIAERKRSEEELQNALRRTRESQKRMSAILSSVSDGLLVLDGTGRVVVMNPAAERLLGAGAAVAVGSPAIEAIRNPELLSCCLRFLAEPASSSVEEIALFDEARGENRDIQVRLTALPEERGRPGGSIAVLLDVTRDREIERLKSEFVTTAAHELRTPLTVIIGFAELLLEAEETGTFSSEQRLEFLAQILEKGDVLTRIIGDFLDLDRIEKGRPLLLEKDPCELEPIVKSAVDHFRRETSAHRFEVALPPGLLPVPLDRARFSQVIDNLLTNAVKYSPAGGTIRVEGKLLDREIEISVADEGIGMKREEVERVFEKFYRADTTSTAVGGLGLGMSVAKGIVEAHGGRIWVESAPQEGTRAAFTLPLDETEIRWDRNSV